jgi:hypothetical protein
MKARTKVKPKAKRAPAVVKQAIDNTFTPMETGQPDADPVPDIDNPTGAAGGLGPMNQEGEGERQNDQLAALEITDPKE